MNERRLLPLPGKSIREICKPKQITWFVQPAQEGLRIDTLLGRTLISRNAGQKAIAQGDVSIDGQTVYKAGRRLLASEKVCMRLVPSPPETINAQEIPLNIIYEDDHIVVINKPKGMVVHIAPGNMSGTLVNALLHHCKGKLSNVGGVQRPGIVHRLDKDTSGLLVVAKDNQTHLNLVQQLKEHTMKRSYLALVHGQPPNQGEVKAPIGRHAVDRKKMAVVVGGRPAYTRFQALERLGDYTLLELQLHTGRTHQIRVHMSHIGFPVAGDRQYGRRHSLPTLTSQALHSWQLSFIHPSWGKAVSFVAPLPDEFTNTLAILRNTERSM